jgi:hypothetical protein
MSLALDFATYVGANTSLTLDTNLFVADEPDGSPDSCAIIISSPGSTKSESGVERMAFQVITKDISYIQSETLAYEIFSLLNLKPGFSSISNVFFCDVFSMPYPMDVDERGRFMFSANFLVSKITP